MLDRIFDTANLGYEMYDSMSVINVVHKNASAQPATWCQHVSFRVFFIISGSGDFEKNTVGEGDVIFVPPVCNSNPKGESLEYVCISVKGYEMNSFAEKLGFMKATKIYYALTDILPIWKSLCDLDFSIKLLRAKGVVYHTVSEIYRLSLSRLDSKSVMGAPEQIKMFLDNNYTDPDLSLKKIGEALSYHPNYISKIFNSRYGMRISRYINIVRVRLACSLMDEGEDSIKEISSLCGFTDEEYFSTVFKQQIGETPKEHIKRLRNPGTAL